jgi:hypothetical protein
VALLELRIEQSLDASFAGDVIAHISEIHQEVTFHAVSHQDLPFLLALMQVLLAPDCVFEITQSMLLKFELSEAPGSRKVKGCVDPGLKDELFFCCMLF